MNWHGWCAAYNFPNIFFSNFNEVARRKGPLRKSNPLAFPISSSTFGLSLSFSSESRFPQNGLSQFLGRKNEVSEFSKMCVCSATEVHYSLHFCRYILRNEKAVFFYFFIQIVLITVYFLRCKMFIHCTVIVMTYFITNLTYPYLKSDSGFILDF